MKSIALIVHLVLAVALTTTVRAQEGLTSAERLAIQALASSKLTLEAAMQKAFEKEPEAIPTRAHLTIQDSRAAWGVEVLSGEVFRTRWFDAASGEFMRSDDRRADGSAQRHRMFHEQGGVGYVEAARIATGEFQDAQTYDVRSNLSGEALTYDVYLMQRERPVWVRVDASGGVVQKGDAPRPAQKSRGR